MESWGACDRPLARCTFSAPRKTMTPARLAAQLAPSRGGANVARVEQRRLLEAQVGLAEAELRAASARADASSVVEAPLLERPRRPVAQPSPLAGAPRQP